VSPIVAAGLPIASRAELTTNLSHWHVQCLGDNDAMFKTQRNVALVLVLACMQLVGCTPLTPVSRPAEASSVAQSADDSLLAATPELDSLLLFATGAAGLMGYALLRAKRPFRNPVAATEYQPPWQHERKP
jgi:hypothetical protein